MKALVVLHNNQTVDEQYSEVTRVHNGKGFRPCDAHIGSNMAKFYLSRGFLTPKQIAYWRRENNKGDMKIQIYWRQLLEAAEQKKIEKQKNLLNLAH